MPDQSSAADEHAILQEITAPLATLPDDALQIVVEADFPVVLRGYDRLAVDAYVERTSQLVAELQTTRTPEAAVRRALERVGEQVSGILQRAHETAEQITVQSRRESEERLEIAREEAKQITASAEDRLKELDVDTDRIWAERHRIVGDARELAGQLLALATEAAERFPPAEEGRATTDTSEVAIAHAGDVSDPGAVAHAGVVAPGDEGAAQDGEAGSVHDDVVDPASEVDPGPEAEDEAKTELLPPLPESSAGTPGHDQVDSES